MAYYEYPERLYLNSQYTNDEKKYLIEIIDELVALSKQVRIEGVLSLEEVADEEKEDFKKFLILTLTDGVSSEMQFAAGLNIIKSTRVEGLECRKMMLYNTGIAMINDDKSIPWIELILYSMLGEIKYSGFNNMEE